MLGRSGESSLLQSTTYSKDDESCWVYSFQSLIGGGDRTLRDSVPKLQ